MRPAHTPYDGSAVPFTIGLKPLDPAEWIEVDDELCHHLARKEELLAAKFDDVFAAEEGTDEAQREVLNMLAEHLPRRFPDIYRRSSGSMEIAPAGRRVALDARPDAPLVTAARLVQEDLVVMRRREEGWRLVAAALCFPSSWSLAEKFGRPLDDIHSPVPGFGRGTRQAALIARIFDSLAAERPVQRVNWSLQDDDELHHPRSKRQCDAGTAVAKGGPSGTDPLAGIFLRVERQTLRKLPLSGDILFTIRIHLDPASRLAVHPDRARLATGLAAQLAALDDGQLGYKGILESRDGLLIALRELARR